MITKLRKIFLLTAILYCMAGPGCIAQIVDPSPDYGDPPYDKKREAIFPETATADQSALARVKRLSKAILQYPGNATLLEKRAIAYGDSGDYTRALADINSAIMVKEGRYSYYLTRAQIEVRAKKYSEALADCRFAKRISRDGGWSDWLRARVYKFMGKKEQSIAAAKDALNTMHIIGMIDPSSIAYKESMEIVGEFQFNPEVNESEKKAVVCALADIGNLDAAPTNEQLCHILGISSSDVKRINNANSVLYVISKEEKTPWRCFLKQSSGERPNQSCHLDLWVDPSVCSLDMNDLKANFTILKIRESVENHGPECILYAKGKKCQFALALSPKGLQSLFHAEFDWN